MHYQCLHQFYIYIFKCFGDNTCIQGPANWRMLYGLDHNQEKGLLLAADNLGYLYMYVFYNLYHQMPC